LIAYVVIASIDLKWNR